MAIETNLIFTLRDQIVDKLRNEILSGRLAEGERLTLMQLVARFGVSRTPIREALQLLTHEGLLEGRPNASVKVSARSPDALSELIIPIRKSLETYALRTIFESLDESDFQHWQGILEDMRQACMEGNFHSIAECDIAFHRGIIRRAKDKDLEAIWNAIVARIRHHFWETQRINYPNPLDVYDEHFALVEKFRNGGIEDAVTALEANIA